jgi:predicted deacylase
MQAWVQHLQSNPVPADKRIVVVPNANPDGIANGTRNNARNVNVDRNFPASNWSASIDTAAGTLPQGGGTSPGSEPEAAALINLTRQLRPRLSVSFHSQGRLVGANMIGDSSAIGGMYASTVGYSTMFNSAEDVMGYGITGEYEDWMGQEMGIPAILVELPSNSGNYLNSQMNALNKLLAL